MMHPDFEALLKQEMGLDAVSIGSPAVAEAVAARAAACKLPDTRAYWDLVRASAGELQALIEAIVVTETWFFRDPEAFAELTRAANEDWLPAHPAGIMRLLSLPCSSGEEPYTMAMALLDSGFPLRRCHIDAVDISAVALARAQCAVYGKNSFRGVGLEFRDRHFEATAQGHRLSDAVRQHVHFRQGNFLAEDLLQGAQRYDGIFCRNLLIYFDRTTQDRAVELLQRMLAPQGNLFVGPSETGLLLDHDFVSAQVPLAFALRRSDSVRPVIAPESAQKVPVSPSAPAKAPAVSPARSSPAGLPGLTQDEAFRLADQGRLGEAERCCEEHLRIHGPSVQMFFLMGLIRATVGNLAEAGQYYRKALYLDQDHHDTLVHFSLLLDEQGATAGAQLLRDRLQRLQQKKTA